MTIRYGIMEAQVHAVNLSQETFARLQAHAVPLVDSIETVINRALDALDKKGDGTSSQASGFRSFSSSAPPDLSFTTVKSVTVEGKRHAPSETYWNSLMMALIRLAAKRGMSADEIGAQLVVNNVPGQKEDGGYKYIKEAGLSVQGQDANAAWRAAHHLASAIGATVEVTFMWQQNPKAAYPGEGGSFLLTGSKGIGGPK